MALGQLAKTCDFGDYLDEALQTQFINNVSSPRIKEKIEEGTEFSRSAGKGSPV